MWQERLCCWCGGERSALILVAQHGKVKYVCHAVSHSDTNAPKSSMVSGHRTFLFLLFRLYLCQMKFIQLRFAALFCGRPNSYFISHLAVKTELKDHMLDHIIRPRDRNCLGLTSCILGAPLDYFLGNTSSPFCAEQPALLACLTHTVGFSY